MDKVEKGILGATAVFAIIVIICCIMAIKGINELSQLLKQEGLKGIVEQIWEGDKNNE